MCFILHKWGKWEQYELHYKYTPRIASKYLQEKTYSSTDLRQRRICKRCGKMQDELVKEHVRLNT